MSHPYIGLKVALPTKHKKGEAVRAGFKGILEIDLVEVEVDTDQLGTFSGEVARRGTPLETAIRKADLGAKSSGLKYAIASEGTISNDAQVPILISDVEVMVFKDYEEDLVIVESHRSFEINAARFETIDGNDIDHFLAQADFPNHGIIAMGVDIKRTKPIKGITNHHALTSAIKTIRQNSPKVILENDFRAHFSPSRMVNIKETAKRLAMRISSQCSSCNSPGWGVVGYEKGVNCQACKRLNPDAIHREILGCVRCDHRTTGEILFESLPAERCIWCNP